MTADAEIMAAIGKLERTMPRNGDAMLVCAELRRRMSNYRTMGAIGGKARAAKLTPERRREIARQAAKVRWQPLKP